MGLSDNWLGYVCVFRLFGWFRRWLQHQGSTHCELCKHEFQFAPVYAADAPERLSYFELIQGAHAHTDRMQLIGR